MHLLLTILGGVLLLAVFALFGRLWGAGAASVALAAKAFVPVWLGVAVANLWVGVHLAGCTLREELPILGIVFAVPTALAALPVWHFSKP